MITDVADPVRRLRDVILEAEDDATAWRAAIFLMSRDHPNPVVEALVTQRETIGEQALASMAEHGLKQHEVARAAGVSQPVVSRLRTGGYVSHPNKVAIAKAVARILAARKQGGDGECEEESRQLVRRVIIGVDPGSSAVPGDGAGIAWLSEDEEGCFTVTRAPHESLAGYCARLRDQIETLLPRWAEGSMVVIEAPFSSPRFPQVGMRLSRVVGVVAEIAERAGATVVEVPPTKLRAAHAIKAKGKAGKAEMENAMKARGHHPQTEHEADAWACVEHALRHTVPA